MTNHVPSASTGRTMSSIEIAQLTDKNHPDVMRDIRVQLYTALYGHQFDKANLLYPSIQGLTAILDAQTKRTKEILLDKYHTDILVSGYEVKYRAAIVKRWHELEEQANKPAFTLPDFTDPAEAAIAWAAEFKAKREAEALVESQKEVIQKKDDLIIASNEASIKAGEILIREFVKSQDLVDMGEKQFFKWLREHKIVFLNSDGVNEPYQHYVRAGYFTFKPSDNEVNGLVRYTLRVTPRGKIWLSAKYMAYLDNAGLHELNRNGLVLLSGGAA
jgi:phage antirepressor YoqD-like protein